MSFGLSVCLFFSSNSRAYRILELKALDLRFILRGDRLAVAPIVHIDIDDQSLEKLGRWPWPRIYHARLLDILSECKARQVIMDVLFMERLSDAPSMDEEFSRAMRESKRAFIPCYFSEEEYVPPAALREALLKDISLSADLAAESLGISPEALKESLPFAKRYVIQSVVSEALRRNPGFSEEDLLRSVEETRGWFLFPAEEQYVRQSYRAQKSANLYAERFSIHYPSVGRWPYARLYKGLIAPLEDFQPSLEGSGFINAEPDLDGVTRRVPLFAAYEERVIPQLAVAALLKALQVEDVQFLERAVVLKSARLGSEARDIVIPVDRECKMLVNWQGRWGYSFKHLPYHSVLKLQEIREQLEREGEDGAEYLRKAQDSLKERLTAMVKDKICVVGLTATGTHDMRPVPLQANYPLVGTHANLINTILSGGFIRRASWQVNLCIFLVTALIVGCSSLLKLWKSLLVSLCCALGYFAAAFIAFDRLGLWVDLVGPESIVVFGLSAITSFRYFTEEREKLWIKQAFSHYLSHGVINELLEDPSRLKLGGERRNLSVLFSDVRGFTSFSESHQPEEVVAMLNEILTQQVEVVFRHSGTLDKFVGDELMAFFGAPGETHRHDHALAAVRVAVEIQQKLKNLQEKWSNEKREALRIGIGINSGDMVVGNMGSLERMDYTVIGDNVNLAARLCSAAGADEILISEATYAQVKEQVVVEKLEPIFVKGKSNPIPIYRVKGLR